jgi:tetraacyldisaccharide 4'-kinase
MQNSIKSSSLSQSLGQIAHAAKDRFVAWLPKNWRTFNFWHLVLMPLSWLFYTIALFRKYLYQAGVFKSFSLPVPVIVVGNINVGGTGKTPLVVYLVEQLQAIGLNPGVISRGYGVKSAKVRAVSATDLAAQVGDEPLLLKQRLGCPVYVHPNRVLAGQKLLEENPECDIIISDDGLQHYRLRRAFEIVVVDAQIGFGNGALLPAGPLREPISRLKSVDAIVTNGVYVGTYAFSRRYGNRTYEMQLETERFYNLQNSNLRCDANDFFGKKIYAVAGIGNPARFFDQLATMGLRFKSRRFPDHHAFDPQDFAKIRADAILMTEKDAVKCVSFAQPNFWVLPISVMLDEGFLMRLFSKLESLED